MGRTLQQWLIVTSLILAIGGHWAILQSVAWVGMVVNYSESFPIQEALVKTFDGKHPCKICKVVREGKKSEQRQSLLKVETKLDFWLARRPVLLYPPTAFNVFTREVAIAQIRTESPPTPPPRAA